MKEKIKIRDLTEKEFIAWRKKHCNQNDCINCPFLPINCTTMWLKRKESYADNFLNQEIVIDNDEPLIFNTLGFSFDPDDRVWHKRNEHFDMYLNKDGGGIDIEELIRMRIASDDDLEKFNEKFEKLDEAWKFLKKAHEVYLKEKIYLEEDDYTYDDYDD